MEKINQQLSAKLKELESKYRMSWNFGSTVDVLEVISDLEEINDWINIENIEHQLRMQEKYGLE